MTWNPNLSYGASGEWFGHRDYTGNLKEIWDAYDPGVERQKKLMQRRQDILSWMGSNPSKIRERNRIGVEGGLGSMISSGDYNKKFMGTNMDIRPGTTEPYSQESANWYGYADLQHQRAAGKSWTDILGGLDTNKGDLRNRNIPGGGGLYDEVKTQANFEKQTGAWADSMQSLQDQMGLHFTDLSGKFEGLGSQFQTGMGGVSDAITAQTAAEERYRADQQNWQRRQENMQQMMMQEGRRKSKEKPVMAVMPGQGAYGGGGGGAAAFARKKKQTTGLNIA
tara:strand:- start:1711 stop:2550 length:840 start_codon:yes stop_codon:yes gene_type:complete